LAQWLALGMRSQLTVSQVESLLNLGLNDGLKCQLICGRVPSWMTNCSKSVLVVWRHHYWRVDDHLYLTIHGYPTGGWSWLNCQERIWIESQSLITSATLLVSRWSQHDSDKYALQLHIVEEVIVWWTEWQVIAMMFTVILVWHLLALLLMQQCFEMHWWYILPWTCNAVVGSVWIRLTCGRYRLLHWE
jgi:hypothetical protein